MGRKCVGLIEAIGLASAIQAADVHREPGRRRSGSDTGSKKELIYTNNRLWVGGSSVQERHDRWSSCFA